MSSGLIFLSPHFFGRPALRVWTRWFPRLLADGGQPALRKQTEDELSLALIVSDFSEFFLLTRLAVGLGGSVSPAPQRRSPQVAVKTEVSTERIWVPRCPHSHAGIKQTKNKETLALGQARASAPVATS